MSQIARKNVFILGAGASHEFGLPTGHMLKSELAKILDIRYGDWGNSLESGNRQLAAILRELPELGGANELQQHCWNIRDNMSLAPSIDNFLHTHSENIGLVGIGKIAITIAILEAEKNSKLKVKNDQNYSHALDLNTLGDTWINRLFSILISQKSFDNFLETLDHITFVSFNYDRCVQYFFYYAAKQYFSLDNLQAEKTLQHLKILNPYGNVGPFIGNSSRPTFGRILANPQLVNVSKNLKTFTEGVVGEVQEEIRDVISEADVVAYLGFGYLPLNMQVISSNRRKATQFVVGTTKGLSRFSNKVITERLVDEIALNNSHVGQPNSVNLMDLTCSELMHEFEMMFLT